MDSGSTTVKSITQDKRWTIIWIAEIFTMIVAGVVTVEADLVEEVLEANMAANAVDAEYNVAKAEVFAVATDKKDIMETKVSTLTLTIPAS